MESCFQAHARDAVPIAFNSSFCLALCSMLELNGERLLRRRERVPRQGTRADLVGFEGAYVFVVDDAMFVS